MRIQRVLNELKKHARSASAVGLSRVFSLLAVGLGTRVLTSLADPATFGEFKLVHGLGVLAGSVLLSPLVQYAMLDTHIASADSKDEGLIATARRSVLFVGTGLMVFLIPVSVFAAMTTGHLVWALIGAAAALNALARGIFGLERGLLVSHGRVIISAKVDALTAMLLPLAAAAALLMGQSSISMVLAQTGVLFGIGLLLRGRNLTSSPTVSTRDWLRGSMPFAIPLAAVGMLGWLFNIGDRYLVAALTDTGAAGTYAAAYGLAASPLAALGGILPTLAYAPLYRATASGKTLKRRQLSGTLLRRQVALIGLGVVTVVVFSPLAVSLFLAPEYHGGSVAIMRWVAIGQGFQVAAYALDLDSFAVSQTHRLAIAYVGAVSVGLSLNLALIPRLGTEGAAIATAASGLAYFLIMLAQVRTNPR